MIASIHSETSVLTVKMHSNSGNVRLEDIWQTESIWLHNQNDGMFEIRWPILTAFAFSLHFNYVVGFWFRPNSLSLCLHNWTHTINPISIRTIRMHQLVSICAHHCRIFSDLYHPCHQWNSFAWNNTAVITAKYSQLIFIGVTTTCSSNQKYDLFSPFYAYLWAECHTNLLGNIDRIRMDSVHCILIESMEN